MARDLAERESNEVDRLVFLIVRSEKTIRNGVNSTVQETVLGQFPIKWKHEVEKETMRVRSVRWIDVSSFPMHYKVSERRERTQNEESRFFSSQCSVEK